MHACIDYGRVGIALLAGYGLAFGGTHWRDASALASYSLFFSFVLGGRRRIITTIRRHDTI
ncbi:hypothetical protein F5144DRAFT_145538 [Chaetomium tenue]|uniref:Uncharacterized protein n=1 Tax=Chaetomium tenue TaxID=1854479 RepID=A0ACB7PJE5_9PEZI|nr:hypothetical protein F5144DRAFT_145538 [Chaetomium globosum]